jgi:hypothetical protein
MAGEIKSGAILGGCDAPWTSKISFLSVDARLMNLKRLLNVNSESGESSACSVCSIASAGWLVAAMVKVSRKSGNPTIYAWSISCDTSHMALFPRVT